MFDSLHNNTMGTLNVKPVFSDTAHNIQIEHYAKYVPARLITLMKSLDTKTW